MARTTGTSGFKLRSGNASSFKQMGMKPGSSKEELIEISKQFVTPVEDIDLDYTISGGYGEIDPIYLEEGSGKPKDDPYTSGIDPSNKSGKVRKNVGGKTKIVKAKDRFKDDPNRRVKRTKKNRRSKRNKKNKK
tara:strand:+ start:697 stop:1098 length:402 start_codon:yes stop_codon:yes gene_type:complete